MGSSSVCRVTGIVSTRWTLIILPVRQTVTIVMCSPNTSPNHPRTSPIQRGVSA